MTSAAPAAVATAPEPPATLTPGDAGSVSLRGVSKRYGQTLAVDTLDLEIRAGEFCSLLGPSGCGKTTTLRMIGGFEQPDAGDILISGAGVAGLPPHKRAVNTVFQAYALFPHMSVAENVAYGLRQRRVPRADLRQRVGEALGMVQMSELASRNPRQLSGGQQQRVALARALVNRPAVLLLDEPMSALDRKLREEMQVELKLLQSRLGTTFVFVTHDQEEALSMSDRVAVMDGGRLQQIGAPDDVYDHPRTAFVAGFIGKQNFFPGRLERAETSGLRVAATSGGTHLTIVATPTVGAPATGAVRCAVRPEAVDVSALEGASAVSEGAADGAPVNAVDGVVAGVSHLGHALQLVVVTDGGQELLVRAQRSAGAPTTPGTRVRCTWPSGAVHVFPA